MTEALRATKMNLSGLLHVLGDALYSTPDIVVRELVQNAHDSCVRKRIEAGASEADAWIRVRTEPGVLIVEDCGAGLTCDEIDEYLATVGSGYTRLLREGDASGGRPSAERNQLIGCFGLGFLSAYVVAERVSVWTCSYQTPDEAWLFTSRGGQQYAIRSAEARDVGTEVRLELEPAHRHLSEPGRLDEILRRYCSLIDVPLLRDGVRINRVPPPWRDPELPAHPLAQRRACLEFAAQFERVFAPLVTHLIRPAATDGSSSSAEPVRGLVWVQDGASYASSDQRNVSLFVRGMWIGCDERELLPAWAGFFGAVLESDVLEPTASRESLKRDAHFRAARAQLEQVVIEALLTLAAEEHEAWQAVRLRHNEALLAACLCEPALFGALADLLVVPTSEGEFTLPALLRRSQQTLYLSQATQRGAHELLFRALRMPIVDGSRYAVAPFCRAYAERHQSRLVELGTEAGEHALFRPAGLDAESERQLAACFDPEVYQVMVRRFSPAFLPFVAVEDELQQLKERMEADATNRRIASAALGLARLYTESVEKRPATKLYVNADSPIVELLLCLPAGRREQALDLLGPWILSQSARAGDTTLFEETFERATSALASLCRLPDARD